MPSFSIRPATVEDIPSIIAVQELTWEPTYREILSREQIDYMFDKIYSTPALHHQMTAGGQQFLILEAEDVIMGFAAVSEDEPETFKLHKIYVLPSSQGTGAGKFLLQSAEDYVKGLGAKKMTLNVNRYNRARFFYEKMGYSIIREEDIAMGPYWMNDYILEKALV